MVDKAYAIRKVGEEMERTLESILKSHSSAKKETIESEGRMQTRYDSTKTEMGYLTDGLAQKVIDLKNSLDQVSRFNPEESYNIVSAGAIFTLSDKENTTSNTYFVVPYSRGMDIVASGEKITVINPKAPIAKSSLGKKVGDPVILNDYERYITDIY